MGINIQCTNENHHGYFGPNTPNRFNLDQKSFGNWKKMPEI